MSVDWVVLDTSTTAKCLRCEAVIQLPALPMNLTDWCEECERLTSQHRDCPAPNFTDLGKQWIVEVLGGKDMISDDRMARIHYWMSLAILKIEKTAYHSRKSGKSRANVAECLGEAFALFRDRYLGGTKAVRKEVGLAPISLDPDDPARLRELLEPLSWNTVLRESCHATYNGGHHDDATRRAFHHGIDTVCNVLESAMNNARKYLEGIEGTP